MRAKNEYIQFGALNLKGRYQQTAVTIPYQRQYRHA